jgi:hypothetical protein
MTLAAKIAKGIARHLRLIRMLARWASTSACGSLVFSSSQRPSRLNRRRSDRPDRAEEQDFRHLVPLVSLCL